MMSPEGEQKMKIGQAMGKSFMIALAGIVLALAEKEARLVGVGILPCWPASGSTCRSAG